MSGDSPHAGGSVDDGGNQQAENAEVLVPMMRQDFIEAKVSCPTQRPL